MSKELTKFDKKELIEYEIWTKAAVDNANNLDKIVLTLCYLSTGVLLTNFYDKVDLYSKCIYIFSIIFFILTIIIVLSTFYYNKKYAVNILRVNLSTEPEYTNKLLVEYEKIVIIGIILELFKIIFFIAGIFCSFIFILKLI